MVNIDPWAIIPIIEKFQIMDFFLPMLLFTAIFYAVLAKIKMFEKNRTNTILSLTLAAIITFAHLTGTIDRCWDVIAIMNTALPKLGIYIFGLLIFMIMLGIVGVAKQVTDNWKNSFLAVTLLFLIYSFLTSRGSSCSFNIDISGEGAVIVLIFGFILLIGYLVVKATPD